MPNYTGTVVNGRWYATSPYGPTNASGGVNLAPYGPWNGMPAGGMSPVIGTPTNYSTTPTVGNAPTVGGPPSFNLPQVPSIGSNPTAQPGALPTPAWGNGFPSGGGNLANDQILNGVPQGSGGRPLQSVSFGGANPTNSTIYGSPTNPVVTGTIANPQSPYSGISSGLATAQPDLASITQLVNQLNLQGQQQANAGRIPGATGLETQSSNNIASLLSGNIPADVVRNLTQNAAERGIAMGSPGGPNANANLLQSLGLTSLGLQQTGQQNLSAALGRNPAAPIFDPTTQLLTPAQKAAIGEANARLGLDWYKALYGGQGGGGSRGGGGGGQTPTDNSWFGDALRRATGGGGVGVPQYPGPIPYRDPYGGFNPEWPSDTSGDTFGGIIPGTEGPMGPFDPYGGYNPENPDFGTSINDYYGAGYDPFASYDSSGGDFYGGFNPENPGG